MMVIHLRINPARLLIGLLLLRQIIEYAIFFWLFTAGFNVWLKLLAVLVVDLIEPWVNRRIGGFVEFLMSLQDRKD